LATLERRIQVDEINGFVLEVASEDVEVVPIVQAVAILC